MKSPVKIGKVKSKAILFCFLAVTPVFAGQKLNDPIAPGSKITFAELLRQVFPDLEVDDGDPTSASANKWVPVRQFDLPSPADWEGSLAIDSVDPIPIKIAGAPQILLQFRADADSVQPQRTIALFQLTSSPKLLDIGTVAAWPDDFGTLKKSDFSLGPDSEAFETATFHSNSSQGYEGRRFFTVAAARIVMIYDAELLNGQCVMGETFTEKLSVSTAPDRPYNKVIIRVVLTFVPNTDCSEARRTKESTRVFSATLHWDQAQKQFIPSSQQLSELDAFNEKRR